MKRETLISVKVPMSDLAALQVLAKVNNHESAGNEIRVAIKEHLRRNKDKMANLKVFVKQPRKK